MEEFKRKLASVRLISDIKLIEGADNIELAIVDGWQCIVKKGEFSPGDFCVYFEIDSFLPIRPEYEFLRKSSYKKMGDQEGFRLKTIKLRGKISQGLVLAVNVLEGSITQQYTEKFPFTLEEDWLGYDLTEELGVVKYDPPLPACLGGVTKGNFPSFICKTDLERIQNIWNKIRDLEETYEVTIKLDGTSCTFYLNEDNFGVCSRNLDLKETEGNTYWKMARQYNIEAIMRKIGRNLALQGEIIGEGIQGNPEGIRGQEFYLFDVWDIDTHQYLKPEERKNILFSIFKTGITLAGRNSFYPIIECPMIGIEFLQLMQLEELLNSANGKSLHADMREGIVFKSMISDMRFKVVSNEYLLKEK